VDNQIKQIKLRMHNKIKSRRTTK